MTVSDQTVSKLEIETNVGINVCRGKVSVARRGSIDPRAGRAEISFLACSRQGCHGAIAEPGLRWKVARC